MGVLAAALELPAPNVTVRDRRPQYDTPQAATQQQIADAIASITAQQAELQSTIPATPSPVATPPTRGHNNAQTDRNTAASLQQVQQDITQTRERVAASHKASLVGKDAATEARQKAAVSSEVAVQQEIMETQPSERVVTSHKECVVGKDAAAEARKAKAEVEMVKESKMAQGTKTVMVATTPKTRKTMKTDEPLRHPHVGSCNTT